MQTMIEIQDDYIAKVMSCQTGHVRRVRIGAARKARMKLEGMGFTTEQARQIVRDAHDMLVLERIAREGEDDE